MADYILAIDQGTTSSRAIIFDKKQKIVSIAQKEFTQHFPKPGWVEHDPEEIWQTVVSTCKSAIRKAKLKANDIAAIGITNQRETVVMWDRQTGKAVHNAIVWQDRRTAEICTELKNMGHEKTFNRKTGLLLDPYFSGTKVSWLLNKVKGLRKKAVSGKIAFGTIDTFLIWRLTGGKSHVTDATNASRTLMFNIKGQKWDTQLLDLLQIPSNILPEVLDCSDNFGTVEKSILGAEIPILGVAGDQQAATIGNACFNPGMVKSTYGTGCFALLNTGEEMVLSKNRLLTTVCYRLGGKVTYALEGSIFMAGASVQWLRDQLNFMKDASESDAMAQAADPQQEIYLVPAFTGLGAPYWDADAKAALSGMTRGTGKNEITRAALESVCYQTDDLICAMQKDWKNAKTSKTVLRVDGGMTASNWTMQELSNILNAAVDRPTILETTAFGAAWLAASRCGLWGNQKSFAKNWALDTRFKPKMTEVERRRKKEGWKTAVLKTLTA